MPRLVPHVDSQMGWDPPIIHNPTAHIILVHSIPPTWHVFHCYPIHPRWQWIVWDRKIFKRMVFAFERRVLQALLFAAAFCSNFALNSLMADLASKAVCGQSFLFDWPSNSPHTLNGMTVSMLSPSALANLSNSSTAATPLSPTKQHVSMISINWSGLPLLCIVELCEAELEVCCSIFSLSKEEVAGEDLLCNEWFVAFLCSRHTLCFLSPALFKCKSRVCHKSVSVCWVYNLQKR